VLVIRPVSWSVGYLRYLLYFIVSALIVSIECSRAVLYNGRVIFIGLALKACVNYVQVYVISANCVTGFTTIVNNNAMFLYHLYRWSRHNLRTHAMHGVIHVTMLVSGDPELPSLRIGLYSRVSQILNLNENGVAENGGPTTNNNCRKMRD